MRNLAFYALALLACLRTSPIYSQAPASDGALYTLDELHSLLDFTARHIGFGRVRGTFTEYDAAAYIVRDDIEKSTFSAVIDVASIASGAGGRDGILRDEFFDVENHPKILFRSTKFERSGEGFLLTGMLSMRDVTKEVQIPVTVVTLDAEDQWQHNRVVFEGELTVDRKEYNLIYDNDFWDSIVSDEIRIDISFGARHYNALNTIFPWRPNQIGTVIRDVTDEKGFESARKRVYQLWEEERDDYSFSFYRIGKAFAQQQRYEESIGVFDLAIELLGSEDTPEDYAFYYTYRGQVFIWSGQIEEARESLEKALEYDPYSVAAGELLRHLEP
ncbi:MAG: YceI family protein [Bacteroidetes bacterium]|nr:YceI family protein [Bacteroidota bacterium]